jgi:hypothetical protein
MARPDPSRNASDDGVSRRNGLRICHFGFVRVMTERLPLGP